MSLFAVQRFSNNDHLAVHRQKHEFSLKFGGMANKSGEALLVGKEREGEGERERERERDVVHVCMSLCPPPSHQIRPRLPPGSSGIVKRVGSFRNLRTILLSR